MPSSMYSRLSKSQVTFFTEPPGTTSSSTVAPETPTDKHHPASPLDTANLLSRLTLFWISPLVHRGFYRPLEEEDLWEVASADGPAAAAALFQANRRTTATKPRWTWGAIYKSYSYEAWLAAGLYLTSVALRFVGPYVLGIIVTFVSQTQTPGVNPPATSVANAYLYAFVLFVSQFFATFFSVKSDFLCVRLGLRARNALIGSTFRQVMSLDNVGRLQTNNGNIISLVSNDSLIALEFTRFFNQAWTAPFVLVGGIVYIQILVGVSVWAGLSVLLLFIPYTIWQGKVQSAYQSDKMKKTDARVKVTNEALLGIKVVKANAWEDALATVLSRARAEEISYLLKLNYLQASLQPLSISTPNIACVITFIVYVALGNTINPATAFSVVSLFVIIRQPFTVFPMAITQASRALVMGRRYDQFLSIASSRAMTDEYADALSISQAAFCWQAPDRHNPSVDFCLEIPSFEPRPGELVAVVGKVASGKSSFVAALMGEMTRLRGSQERPRQVAICLQDPFILNATVRENILFGQPYDPARYDEAIICAALARDLTTLPGGDAAEIGERGINLSGGQKARVALARAAYSHASVVVLDDVLAAVDAEVGAYIFEHMLLGQMRSRTRIVVTNNLDLLARVDRVAVLDKGRLVEFDRPQTLREREDSTLNQILAEIASHHAPPAADSRRPAPLATQHSVPAMDVTLVARAAPRQLERDEFASTRNLVRPQLRDEYVSSRTLQTTANSRSTVAEDRQRGKVADRFYRAYFMSGVHHSTVLVVLLWVCFAVTEANYLAIDSFLAWYSQQTNVPVQNFMLGYGLIALSFLILMFVRSFAFARFHVTAVSELYNLLASSLLKMPMAFYWREPLGRILNRVSADTNIADQLLGQSWSWLIMTVLRVIGILAIIVCAAPIFAVALVPLVLMYMVIREFYRRAARELQRIEGVSRSPLYNHLTETLSGTTTIRAFGRLDEWLAMADDKLVINHRAKFAVEACSVWLVMYSEWLGSLVIFLTALVVVGSRDSIGPGYAGLALSFSLNIVVNLNMSVRQATLVEQQMTAVERMLQTAGEPAEEGLDEGELRVGSDWPPRGEVVFEDVCLLYREGLKPALQGLNLKLEAGEKTGICGRTGAGKSSILVALFRLVDCSQGRVVIDGVDVSKLPKRLLRRKLCMVPQDPVLFNGSVRYNLDPFGEHHDAEIWDALKHAHCDSVCRDQGLGFIVTDQGSNLSAGERALLCLARGILRKSSVVMLDEASAALDSHTDALIQETIRSEFGKATMLVIAHRLDTIVDLDSVCVMGGGKLLEKDHPAVLLRNKDSHFSKLVKETWNEDRLVMLAEEAWRRRRVIT